MKNSGAIAILGGMGPEASAKMLQVLIEMAARDFGAKNCSDFPEIVVFSLPVPDFISNKENISKAESLLKIKVALINKMNVSCIAMACNTAHVMFDDLQAVSRVPFVSIIDETAKEVERRGIKTIGLLATPVTIRAKLFQNAFKKLGIKVLVPKKTEQFALESIIRRVIARENGMTDETELIGLANSLITGGAGGIILGCTELPLVFPNNFSVPVFDSIELLSRALLARAFNYDKKGFTIN